MKLWVALHGGGFNGIDTYAEQVALAAAAVGHAVTLVATDGAVAARLRSRLAPDGITVRDLGLAPLGPAGALAERLSPGWAVRRVAASLRAFSEGVPKGVWHLNRASLAPSLRGKAERICTAAWFYPHDVLGRLRETWGHASGFLPRRAAITAKGLAFYRQDSAGFRASHWIIAPTRALAEQLATQGHCAVACAPPARVPQGELLAPNSSPPRFVACSGDLAHPRKNLFQAAEALAEFTRRRGPATWVAIGRNAGPLEQFTRRAAPLVRFEALGALEPARVQQEMQRSHALLFPSRYEEWGYVAVEALLGGTPVVTYPVYPFDEMLAGGLGATAQGFGAAPLADAMERALALPRGEALRAAAAERFGSRAVGERLTPIWDGRG